MTPPRPPSAAAREGSRTRFLWVAALVLVPALAGAGAYLATRPGDEAPPGAARPYPPAVGEPFFEDVAGPAGLDFRLESGSDGRFLFPETTVGGAAFLDFDGDGWLDVYFVQGGHLPPRTDGGVGNRLYRNRGDGTFEDVTERAGVGDTGYGGGLAVGDYDRDGDLDLFVANLGTDVLYRNEGDGTFTDVTAEAGVAGTGWGTSAAFLDYDNDGDLDLYVVQYIHWSEETERRCYDGAGERGYCGPLAYRSPAPDVLYENEGDGTFRDVTAEMGIDRAFGNGLGVICADFDRDGWIDVYVANDAMPKQMWMNQKGRSFRDRALELGTAVNLSGTAEAGMGVVAFDLEGDADLDILLTHLCQETNTCYLYRDGVFDDRTAPLGLAFSSFASTGFGVGIHDFDQDGYQDIYVANGRVTRRPDKRGHPDPYAELNQVMRGTPQFRFEEAFPVGGTREPLHGTSRGAAFGDYDGDGDVDVVVVERDAPARLLRNVGARPGRWIRFDVVDERGHEALGALVGVHAGGRWQWRLVARAYGYQSSHEGTVHVGLGQAQPDEVRVRWLDGGEDSYGALEAGRVHRLARPR